MRSPTLIPRVSHGFEWLHRPPTLLTWVILSPKQHQQNDHHQNQQPTQQLFRTWSPTLIPRVSCDFEQLYLPPTLLTWVIWPQSCTIKTTISKINNQPQVSSGCVHPHWFPEFPTVLGGFAAHWPYSLCNLVGKTIRPKWPPTKSADSPKSLQDMFVHVHPLTLEQFWVTSPPTNFIHFAIWWVKQYNQSDNLQNQQPTPQLFRTWSPTLIPRVSRDFEQLHLPPTSLTWIIWPQSCTTKVTITKINQRPQVSSGHIRLHPSPEFLAILSDFTTLQLYSLCNLVCKTIRPNWPSPKSTTNLKSLQDTFTHIDTQSFPQFLVTSSPINFTHLSHLAPKLHNQSDHLQNQPKTPSLFKTRSPTSIPKVSRGF